MSNLVGLGLYLHIPFCRHRCTYCDFNTYTSLGHLQDRYAAALRQEIRQVGRNRGLPAETVYFGGGTPSLMSPESLDGIILTLAENFALSEEAEITLEANPDTVDASSLSALRSAGFNRISFGAQSANPAELGFLGREHDFQAVIRAVKFSREAGFNNINLDLIFGLPEQTLDSWRNSLNTALALQPEHLSLYCLTIEAGTPLNRQLNAGLFLPPDPDTAADQYALAGDMLKQAGFEHYEISNWSLPDKHCRHNLVYWRNQEYLGLGAGAHGHAAGYRYWVVKQPRVYIRRMETGTNDHYPWSMAVAGKEMLSPQQAMADTVITQLRLLQEGLDLAAFRANFGHSLQEAFPGTVEQLIDWGLLRLQTDRLVLTKKGRFLSNQVFYRFL